MLSLVGINGRLYRFVELETFRIVEMSREELINFFKNGGKADNIKLNKTYLDSVNGNLGRYKDGVRTNSLVVLYKSIEKDGDKYYVSDSAGKVMKMDTDTLIREGRRHTIANGQIANIGKGENERVLVKSIRGSFREVVPKIYKALDLEDYSKIYSIYTKINSGVHGDTSVGTVINDANAAGFIIEKKIGEPAFDSFLVNYKILQGILNNSKNYTYIKIYRHYKLYIVDGKMRAICKDLLGYLVNLSREQMSVFIPASDKNMVQRLNEQKLLKYKAWRTLKKLFTYGRSETNIDDSAQTCEQVYNRFNEDIMSKAAVELEKHKVLEVQANDDYTFDIGSTSNVKMRYNLNIKARDFKKLRGRL